MKNILPVIGLIGLAFLFISRPVFSANVIAESSRPGAIQARDPLWPNGHVRYRIGAGFDNTQRTLIESATMEWDGWTNGLIHFTNLTASTSGANEPAYIEFQLSDACKMYPPREAPFLLNGDVMIITLTVSCANNLYSIVHEIGHALGLFHEHQRTDYYNYLTYLDGTDGNVDNVDPNEGDEPYSNFDLGILYSTLQPVGPFDFESVMMYRSDAFALSGTHTMIPASPNLTGTPIPPASSWGQSSFISQGDLDAISMLYGQTVSVVNGTGGCLSLRERHLSHTSGSASPGDLNASREVDLATCDPYDDTQQWLRSQGYLMSRNGLCLSIDTSSPALAVLPKMRICRDLYDHKWGWIGNSKKQIYTFSGGSMCLTAQGIGGALINTPCASSAYAPQKWFFVNQ